MPFQPGDKVRINLPNGQQGDHLDYWGGETGVVVKQGEPEHGRSVHIVAFDKAHPNLREPRNHYYVYSDELALIEPSQTDLLFT